MRPHDCRSNFRTAPLPAIGCLFCIAILSLAASTSWAQTQPSAQAPQMQAQSQVMTTSTPAAEPAATPIPADQLDSLVAPIALYPDPLLANVLAASTYPLEIIQLQQWMANNSSLKDKALADAVAKQPWDPSVQSLAVVPEALQRMALNIQWT